MSQQMLDRFSKLLGSIFQYSVLTRLMYLTDSYIGLIPYKITNFSLKVKSGPEKMI